jgi:hypothetical protein
MIIPKITNAVIVTSTHRSENHAVRHHGGTVRTGRGGRLATRDRVAPVPAGDNDERSSEPH